MCGVVIWFTKGGANHAAGHLDEIVPVHKHANLNFRLFISGLGAHLGYLLVLLRHPSCQQHFGRKTEHFMQRKYQIVLTQCAE